MLGFVYSGDSLVELGLNATILIHEVTFEDTMLQDAVDKCHSSVSEAVQVGTVMNAYVTILTHFSQRYATLSALPALLLSCVSNMLYMQYHTS